MAYSANPMALYLVRHAKAGARGYGPADRDRGLTTAGWDQAQSLARWLGGAPVTRLLSSPYLRCRQTLEPLAEATGLAVESVEWLSEGMMFDVVLDRLADVAEGTVLCSHGDVIPEVIGALIRRGTVTLGEPRWEKGSAWVLEREDSEWRRARPIGTDYDDFRQTNQ